MTDKLTLIGYAQLVAPDEVQKMVDLVTHDAICTGSVRVFEVVRAEDGTPSVIWIERTAKEWAEVLVNLITSKLMQMGGDR